MEDEALREEFARDVVLLKYVGLNPIVVHGGGPEITAYMERLGLPVEFVGGLRVSDEDTVEVAKMVLVGKVNKEIVLRLSRHGQPAVGLCGDDGSLFRVARRAAPGGQDIGFVGAIERVNVGVIEHVASDYIPVIASVGADREGNSYNVNADEAAGAVAGALGAHKVIFLTDVPGWLADASRPGEPDRAGERGAGPRGDGGDGRAACAPSSRPACDAIDDGVGAAHILDGRVEHSLLLELFTDAGIGTKIEACDVSLAELQAIERATSSPSYARMPVEFVRGRGSRLWDADGRGVPGLPVRHLGDQPRPLPSADRGRRARAGG